MILAGDVGGTKVYLALYDFIDGNLHHNREERFAAMRLVGATPAQISVISAVESTVAALVGVVLGFAFFFLIAGEDKAEPIREVFMGPRDPERLPSQLIWPSSGILTLFLDKAAAALLPATNGEGCGVLERER